MKPDIRPLALSIIYLIFELDKMKGHGTGSLRFETMHKTVHVVLLSIYIILE